MHSTVVYQNANENIERISELFANSIFVMAILIVLLPLIYTTINYYFLDSGAESFLLFFPAWLPFEWKAPFGYLVAWFAQLAATVAIANFGIGFFNIVFASSWLFIVIAEDLTSDMNAFNNTIESLRRTELMIRFYNIVKSYSVAKR